MARHTYHLQSETIKVMSPHVEGVAAEMDVSDRYIRSILAGTETDPFAKFLELYRACVRAGAPVRHWDERLAEIRELDSRGDLCLKTEAQKYAKESADVTIAAIQDDPHAVLREAREAIACGKRLEKAALSSIDALRQQMGESVAEFRSKRAAVNGGRK